MKLFKKISLAFTIFLLSALPVLAEIIPSAGKEKGNYQLNDAMQLGVNIANWILGIVGSLTLLMFIIAGFTLILSGGNSESVSKGKQMMIAAVVGLLIVFSSYIIVQFSISALGGKPFTGTI